MSYQEFTLRLITAMAGGLIIGMEREWQMKPAGLRTNTLVSIGSAMFVLLSVIMTSEKGDVTRIIGQVVTGIGFLGAGIIFKEGFDIHGLTTAATIWCSAAVGCLAGGGLYIETFIATTSVIVVNLSLIPLDKWLSERAKKSAKQSNNKK